jgi:XkdW protein
MILYKQILVIYPQLTSDDFSPTGTIRLQNDSDGQGDYIKSWTHPTFSQPTQAQLEAANLQPEPVTAEEKLLTDSVAAKNYAKLTALKNMTPTEVQTWVTDNVNTLAQAKDAIITLAVGMSILARRL